MLLLSATLANLLEVIGLVFSLANNERKYAGINNKQICLSYNDH